jgi:hypothetical protein
MSATAVVKTTPCPSNSVDHWSQSWSCGWHQPANQTFAHVGYTLGYWLIPALLVLVAVLAIRAAARNRKGRVSRDLV